MKLYYFPGACSMSPHIVANELGMSLELEKVELSTKKLADGSDFSAVNPKNLVPALRLDNGEILTEGPTIVQYLADMKPGAKLIPAAGTMARYRVQEMLGYINSEIHKPYVPLFNPSVSADAKRDAEAVLRKKYPLLEQRLAHGAFLFGEQFTVADAYLFTVTNWANFVKLDLSSSPNLLAYQKRVAARPAVQATLVAEGLAPAAR